MNQIDGILIIRKNRKNKIICEVDVGGKQAMLVPPLYKIDNESLNGKNCKVYRVSGQIVKIEIDGEELPRKALAPQTSPQETTHQRHIFNKQNRSRVTSHQPPEDSFSISLTKLPRDTRSLPLKDIDNVYLKLNKAARFSEKDDKFLFFKTDKGKIIFSFKTDFSKIDFNTINTKHIHSIEKTGLNLVSFCNHPDWRLVVGLGTDTVYETGITLHHIYGFPYIPGQAVKGALRSFIINEFFGQIEGDKKSGAFSDPLFCDIFGCPKKSFYDEARQGLIWFFDAFPTSAPELEVDIMNPHYGEYYSGNGNVPPADYLNPVPIPFLTVGEKTKFKFIIGAKKDKQKALKVYDKDKSQMTKQLLNHKSDLNISDEMSLLEVVNKLLRKSLVDFGIGAKTAVGYGYFHE